MCIRDRYGTFLWELLEWQCLCIFIDFLHCVVIGFLSELHIFILVYILYLFVLFYFKWVLLHSYSGNTQMHSPEYSCGRTALPNKHKLKRTHFFKYTLLQSAVTLLHFQLSWLQLNFFGNVHYICFLLFRTCHPTQKFIIIYQL